MTAITGLRRLPLVDPDGPPDAATALYVPTWDRPEVELDLTALEGEAGEPESAGDGGDALPPDDGPAGDRRRGPWLRPALVVPVVAALMVGALAVAFVQRSAGSGPGPGEAEVTVDGRARVVRADGDPEVVTDRVRLEPGDRLDLQRGTATFELAADVRFEGTAGTSVLMGARPELRAGELLVDAPAATALRVGPATVVVAEGGAARLGRSYAVQVDVYRGTAEVASAGVADRITALQAVEVAALGEVGSPRPLAYEADDAWDRRYLADAVALDRQLGPLTASLDAAGADPVALAAQVRAALPDPPTAARLAPLLADRTADLDLPIAVAVVGTGAGTRGSFADRWERGLAQRDDGAAWGLVAMDLDAAPDDVTAALRLALDQGVAVLGTADDAEADTTGDETGAADAGPAGADGGSDPAGGTAGGVGGGTDPGAGGSTSGSGGGTGNGGSSGGSTGGGTNPGGPTVTIPPITPPPVTVPGVPVPPVTVPVGGVVGGVVDGVGGVVGGVVEPLAPILGPVVGPGGLLPILPGLGTGGGTGTGTGGSRPCTGLLQLGC